MGRGVQNRGRIGIQPYPVDDLLLKGYVPRTLYVPDDIPVGVSIIAGRNNNTVKIPLVDNDGNILVRHERGNSSAINDTVLRLIQPTTAIGISTTRKISIPYANTVIYSEYIEPNNTDIGYVACTIRSYDYTGSIVNTISATQVNSVFPYFNNQSMSGTQMTCLQDFVFTPDDLTVEYTYWVDLAIIAT